MSKLDIFVKVASEIKYFFDIFQKASLLTTTIAVSIIQ